MRVVLVIAMLFPFLFSRDLAAADDQSIGGHGRFRIDVDYARFFGDDTLVYVEFYYSVPEAHITYRVSEQGFVGGINVFARVRRGAELVAEKGWTVPHTVKDSGELAFGRNLVGLTHFALKPGEYDCDVYAYDFYEPGRTDTIHFPVKVSAFPTTRTALSDVQLCSSIRQIDADPENMFYKNTLEVLPNVSALYGVSIPTLYYYIEAYNLLSAPSETYQVRVLVLDAAGKEVIRHDKSKKRVNDSSVEVGTVKVHHLKGGTYTLAFLLIDSTTNSVVSTAKKFFVYKPGMDVDQALGAGDVSVMASEFAIMLEPELDLEFAHARYISSEAEIRQYKDLGNLAAENERLDAKRAFLHNFWRRRDPTPSSASDGYKDEYRKRIQYANENFRSGYRAGWESDRGRVYVLYGPADEVERHPVSIESLPYEIWNYYGIQGGVIFVFVDRTGYGDWVLVHSTHRNEMRDDNWTRYIKR